MGPISLPRSLAAITLSLAGLSAAQSSATNNLPSCATSMDGVLPSPTPPGWDYSGNVRRYYVAAEEVEWDYAPSGWDNWLGVPLEISPRANMSGANTYGTKWLKALYRGYTDETFTEQCDEPVWQGSQGPTLRSEVGDLVEVMFLNNLSTNYATMHSMGLTYNKASGGAAYANVSAPGVNAVLGKADAVPPRNDAGVEPGGCVVYKWMVEEKSGPDTGRPSKVHSYHSYVAMQQDTNAGLIGPHIVYGRGMMNKTVAEYREFTLLFMIYEESNSWLSGQNAERLNVSSTQPAQQPSFWRRWLQPRAAWGPPGGGHHGGMGDGGHPSGMGGGQGFDPSDLEQHSGPEGGQPAAASQGGPSSAASASASAVASASAAAYQGGPPMGFMPNGGGGFPGAGMEIDTENLYPGNQSVWKPQVVNLAGANQFGGRAPAFFSMNGYIFSNLPRFEACYNDKVIWYVNAYGSMSHVFHMHGNDFEYNGIVTYAMGLNDGEGKTLFMNATGAGLWQVLCHVNFHHTLGMVANYEVHYPGECPLEPLATS